MSDRVLGIDLGTTNSVVAVSEGGRTRVLTDEEGERLIPSVVSFHPSGQIVVGRRARDRRVVDAANTVHSVKRLIGRPFESDEVARARERYAFRLERGRTGGVAVAVRGGTYSLSEISAFVLRRVREVAEAALGTPARRAVITVPANFNDLQRSGTKAAGQVAGLEVLRILNEPTAAALAYGVGRGGRERIAVFDLGGGTFDLTILDLAGDVFEVLATAGDSYLGGNDVDNLVAERMAAQFLERQRLDLRQDPQAFERLRAAAEWAKCELSAQAEVELEIEEIAYGEGGVPLVFPFRMTRPELEALAKPLIERTFAVCEEAFRIAQLRPSQLDGVLLVGGATRMPLVRAMVADYFQATPRTDVDPDVAVALGAALQAEALAPPVRSATAPAVEPVAEEIEIDDDALVPLDEPTASLGGVEEATAALPRGPSAERLEGETATVAVRRSALPGPPTLSGPTPAFPGAAGDPFPAAPKTAKFGTLPDPGAAPGPAFPPLALPVPDTAPQGRPAIGAPPVSTQPVSPVAVARTISVAVSAAEAERRAAAASPGRSASVPLLLDVTPHTLAIETVHGFCEPIIKRNAPIPVEQTKLFTTGRDDQDAVRARICQGESRKLAENQELGLLELTGLRPERRGTLRVEVTFMLDANGILGVRAKDLGTGREQRVQINLVGGENAEEIEAMRKRQEAALSGKRPAR